MLADPEIEAVCVAVSTGIVATEVGPGPAAATVRAELSVVGFRESDTVIGPLATSAAHFLLEPRTKERYDVHTNETMWRMGSLR